MERRVEPELLDELPPFDLRAARSRRDLGRLNVLMRHESVLARCLGEDTHCPPERLIDLGGGDGSLLLSVARKLAVHWPRVEVTLVDRHDVVNERTRAGFRELGWPFLVCRADAVEWLRTSAPQPSACVMANLFLHHFPEGRLRELLLALSERAAVFVACEPRRGPVAWAASKLVWLAGCGEVTRHDAPVSVRAGFIPGELSSLWPENGHWRLREASAGAFSHCFRAERLPTQS